MIVYDKLWQTMKEKGITYTVRGVRNDSDYLYENEMHLFNKSLYPEIITLFIPCDKEFAFISSTAVRNAVKNGEDLTSYLSSEVCIRAFRHQTP